MRNRNLNRFEWLVAGAFLVSVYLCWLALDAISYGAGWLRDRIRKR